jgi:hypothetical protein
MESTKHTAGAWHVKDGQIYPEGTGITIAVIPHHDKDNEEKTANAERIVKCVNGWDMLEWNLRRVERDNEYLKHSRRQTAIQRDELQLRLNKLVVALERIKSTYDNLEDAAGVIAKEALSSVLNQNNTSNLINPCIIALGVNIRVVASPDKDETQDTSKIGQHGIITDYNTNGHTGNTTEYPLYIVTFEDGSKESFWFEELEQE